MRVVIDTNVLFEGLSRKGICGRVVDLWVEERFTPCVSTALAIEYEAALTRNQSKERQLKVRMALQALILRARFVPILFSYRPQSPDPDDDLVIDCAMNAGASVVTSNLRDFAQASKRLGFGLLTPTELVGALLEV
jgi:putative PIN family toxin of toxin-antitoxin system